MKINSVAEQLSAEPLGLLGRNVASLLPMGTKTELSPQQTSAVEESARRLTDMAREMVQAQPDGARELLLYVVVDIGKQIGQDAAIVCEAALECGHLHVRSSEYHIAKEMYEIGLKHQSDDKEHMANVAAAKSHLGSMAIEDQRFEDAISLFSEQITLARQAGRQKEELRAMYGLAVAKRKSPHHNAVMDFEELLEQLMATGAAPQTIGDVEMMLAESISEKDGNDAALQHLIATREKYPARQDDFEKAIAFFSWRRAAEAIVLDEASADRTPEKDGLDFFRSIYTAILSALNVESE